MPLRVGGTVLTLLSLLSGAILLFLHSKPLGGEAPTRPTPNIWAVTIALQQQLAPNQTDYSGGEAPLALPVD